MAGGDARDEFWPGRQIVAWATTAVRERLRSVCKTRRKRAMQVNFRNWSGELGLPGGEGEIRTHGTREGTTVFETVPIDHSGTSPRDAGV